MAPSEPAGHDRGNRPECGVSQRPTDVSICAIVRAELLFGAARSQDPAKEQARVEVFLAPFVSFPFDDAAAEKYAEIRRGLEGGGERIGAPDLEIAAIAVAHQVTLITHNVSEFSRVSGLVWEDWESVP